MEQRRNAIVGFVNSKGSVSFAQLKAQFPQVSEMTLRTDLKALDADRRLVRVHGGAKSVEVVAGTDDLLGRRARRSAEEKQLIARKAVDLLRPNTTIYLDSGSTATAVARLIPDEPYLIVTSGLSCALELTKLSAPQVLLPGGTLNRYSLSISGSRTIQDVEQMNYDLMFLGVTSYSPDTGFTCGAEEERLLKRAAIRRSGQVAVLLDSSKLGLRSTFSICDLDSVDIILSDGKLPQSMLEECRRQGVTVY